MVAIELLQPRGYEAEPAIQRARELKRHGVDIVNIPDGPRASARMSALSAALLVQQQVGIETVLHYACRDRNLLGMQSDLLGAHAMGIRNLLRGDGYFTIDTSVGKSWPMGISNNRLGFRWDVFNVTNTPRFDVGQMQSFPDVANFGQYNGVLATCDARAGRCMQFGLRYDF